MRYKKAQTEIMGLMIVVILIVMAALLYLYFVINQEPASQETTIQNIQATNLINALMNVKVCNNEISIKEAIVACGNNEDVCQESNSCKYVENQLIPIIDKSLDYKYKFTVKKREDILIGVGECEFGIASPIYTFSDKGDLYESQFLLCLSE